jgi:hypothetical protein
MSNEPKAESRTVDSVVGKRRYRVWFEQINQTYYDVEGQNECDAQVNAMDKWRDDFHSPIMEDIQELSNRD